MEANQIVFRHWDDVVFENRNKLYGAYLLRRTYARHLLSGLAFTVLVVSVILLSHGSREGQITAVDPPVTAGGVICVLPPPPMNPPPRLPERRVNASTKKSGPIVVTREEAETPEELHPAVNVVGDDAVIGNGDVVPVEGTGLVVLPEPAPAPAPEVVSFAEVMPFYEGGLEAMMKFIQKKIRYPRVPRQMGIEGTVYVGFVVTGSGAVTDVHILRGVHPDYDKEAMRVISMLPLWKGGSHNGRPVSVRMVMPIKFELKG